MREPLTFPPSLPPPPQIFMNNSAIFNILTWLTMFSRETLETLAAVLIIRYIDDTFFIFRARVTGAIVLLHRKNEAWISNILF